MANPLSFEEPQVPMTSSESSTSATKRVGNKLPTKSTAGVGGAKATASARQLQDKSGQSKDNQPQSNNNKKKKRRFNPNGSGKGARPYDGLLSGLLAIAIYALMHESGILTIALLAFVWWYSLEESHQRIFLFFLVILNFAEYFYLLPPVLARYQQEDWWDVPTIKTALLTMGIFWSIAWFSAYTGSYLENQEEQRKKLKEQRRLQQQALFTQTSTTTTTPKESPKPKTLLKRIPADQSS